MNSNDLILSLASKEFKDFFNQNIFPLLRPIEFRRKELYKKKKTADLIGVIFTVIAVISIIAKFPLSVLILMSTIIAYLTVSCRLKNKFRMEIGENVMPLLFSYFGDFKFYRKKQECPVDNSCDSIRYLLSNLKIYSRYDDIVIDDCIEGKYNELCLKITELDISYETGSGKSRRTVRVFDGLMLEVDMNKNLKNSHTIIKADKGILNPGKQGELEKVALEDIEFEKEFEVYSNDQIESRYLLTTTFMKRLLDFKRAKKKKVEAAFLNNKGFFFIDYNEDKFEIPFNKPATDFKYYQNVLMDLARILSLVDALKLEEKIGL